MPTGDDAREDGVDMTEEARQDIGSVLVQLADTIHARRDADPTRSYTARLLTGPEDGLLKKVGEEACEVVMAAKDADHDHVLYESADLLYHLMVVLERYGVGLDELTAELRERSSHTNGERTDRGEALHAEACPTSEEGGRS